ncbi:MAG: ribulokinase [Sphingobacterium sp.]
MNKLIIGMDFGTDSVRGLLIDPIDGTVLAKFIAPFKRWAEGLYCDSSTDRYRQHPLDYMEAIDEVLTGLLADIGADDRQHIVAIGTNTTGSTPVPVGKDCVPLSLTESFQDNPDAMFILWKDHTSVNEADGINELAKKWRINFTKYCGELYSSEWFWSKIWHINKKDKRILQEAYTWVEQSDWIPMYLAGINSLEQIKRNRCAAGHKAMWNQEHGGLPSAEFLCSLDPAFYHLVNRMYHDTYTSDQVMGTLSSYFVDKFGLSAQVLITVGGIDAHHGAVGAGITPYTLVKVIGTSTCDMLVLPKEDHPPLVKGICGQVDGSILPGMIGYEAGQSAFGDIYRWFRNMIVEVVLGACSSISESQRVELTENLLIHLSDKAALLPVTQDDLVFTDYHNGRRTPDVDFTTRGAAYGFSLSTTAVHMFKALVEATAFGSRAILERFKENDISIQSVVATGGITSKSPFVIQVLADVLQRDIHVVDNDQTCALGAVIFAAVAAGIYPDVLTAQKHIGAKISHTYKPREAYLEVYSDLYQKYRNLMHVKP